MKSTLLLVCSFLAAPLAAQVTMYSSPVNGNPVDLVVRADQSQVFNVRLIIGSPAAGLFQSTCYVQCNGSTVRMYNTESGSLVETSSGDVGAAATLTSPRCSANLAASTYNGINLSLRLTSTASPGTSLPINAVYTRWGCSEDCETYSSVGFWTVQTNNPPPAQPATLTGPTPGSVLPGSGATFTWTSGTGISSYALTVGTYPGASNLAYQSTTALTLNIFNLPVNGSLVYVKLSSWTGAQWLDNSYTFTANTPVVPVQIVSPAPGSIVTSTSPTLSVNTGVNVEPAWFQVGSVAGSGADYQYPTLASQVNVPRVNQAAIELFVTVSSSFQGGWLAQSTVYGTSAGGAPVSRAAKIIAPAAGAVLAGMATFQWDAGSQVSKYRFTAGSEAGWTNLANQEYPFTTTSHQVSVPATGRKVFITIWSLIGNSWQANSSVYDTLNQNGAVPSATKPATLLVPGAPLSGRTYPFQWVPGVGANQYWLKVGTSAGASDIFNQNNIGTNTLQATVTLPRGLAKVDVTLCSNINGNWNCPSSIIVPLAPMPGSVIPPVFLTCIAAGAPGVTCILPTGTYYMWDQTIAGAGGVPPLNAPLVVSRSGITVRGETPLVPGALPSTILVRYGASDLSNQPGCKPMMSIADGVNNVSLGYFVFEGNSGAYQGKCRVPKVNPSDAENQPKAQDLFILGGTLGNSEIGIYDSEFRNSISEALVMYGNKIKNITVSNNRFIEPNVVGMLVGNNGVSNEYTICDPLTAPGGLPAASVADVPSNVQITGNYFLRSWTGSIALNFSRQVIIQSNTFTDNYQRPYDNAGGTMNTTSCDYDTKILNNEFSGWGLTGEYYTQALELHGHKELIQGNTISGYPYSTIVARSTKDLVIQQNTIQGNGQVPGYKDPAIDIWNQAGNRVTTGVTVINNAISNVSPSYTSAPGDHPYGLIIRKHRCAGPPFPFPHTTLEGCENDFANLSKVNDVGVSANQIIGMRFGPYCTNSVAMGTGWNPSGGWLLCSY